MNNVNNDYLAYKGFVKIKLRNGNRVIRTITNHNEGTLWLFRVLASCLAGNNETNNMPRYLDAYDKDGRSILTSKVAVTGKSVEPVQTVEEGGNVAVNGYKTVFRAVIPYSLLVSGDKTIHSMSLFGSPNNDDTKLASIYLEDEEVVSMSNTQNILVEWSMTIANYIAGGNV